MNRILLAITMIGLLLIAKCARIPDDLPTVDALENVG